MFWIVTRTKLELGLCVVLLLAACLSAVWEGKGEVIQSVSTGVRELPIYSVICIALKGHFSSVICYALSIHICTFKILPPF